MWSTCLFVVVQVVAVYGGTRPNFIVMLMDDVCITYQYVKWQATVLVVKL